MTRKEQIKVLSAQKGSMRRQDKAIQEEKDLERILIEAKVCRLAMTRGGIPYVVPLSYGYQNGVLYFHAAATGMKLEILQENPYVCFELDQINEPVSGKRPCNWTMRYESIIGFGTVEFIEENQAKREALNYIYAHYAGAESGANQQSHSSAQTAADEKVTTDDKVTTKEQGKAGAHGGEKPAGFDDEQLERVVVFRLPIKSMTGKRSG